MSKGQIAYGQMMEMIHAFHAQMEGVGKNQTISWETFLQKICAMGFKCGFRKHFVGHGVKKANLFDEEEVILFLEDKGILIYAETFGGKNMGRAVVYGEIRGKLKEKKDITVYFKKMQTGENSISFSMRVSKNFDEFRMIMEQIFGSSDFDQVWENGMEPIFLNYMEKERHEKAQQVTEEKIASSCPEVKKIIYGN